MARRAWLLVSVVVLLLVAAYVVYDWTRPCAGGPVKQFVLGTLKGGSFIVRCAG